MTLSEGHAKENSQRIGRALRALSKAEAYLELLDDTYNYEVVSSEHIIQERDKILAKLHKSMQVLKKDIVVGHFLYHRSDFKKRLTLSVSG